MMGTAIAIFSQAIARRSKTAASVLQPAKHRRALLEFILTVQHTRQAFDRLFIVRLGRDHLLVDVLGRRVFLAIHVLFCRLQLCLRIRPGRRRGGFRSRRGGSRSPIPIGSLNFLALRRHRIRVGPRIPRVNLVTACSSRTATATTAQKIFGPRLFLREEPEDLEESFPLVLSFGLLSPAA